MLWSLLLPKKKQKISTITEIREGVSSADEKLLGIHVREKADGYCEKTEKNIYWSLPPFPDTELLKPW